MKSIRLLFVMLFLMFAFSVQAYALEPIVYELGGDDWWYEDLEVTVPAGYDECNIKLMNRGGMGDHIFVYISGWSEPIIVRDGEADYDNTISVAPGDIIRVQYQIGHNEGPLYSIITLLPGDDIYLPGTGIWTVPSGYNSVQYDMSNYSMDAGDVLWFVLNDTKFVATVRYGGVLQGTIPVVAGNKLQVNYQGDSRDYAFSSMLIVKKATAAPRSPVSFVGAGTWSIPSGVTQCSASMAATNGRVNLLHNGSLLTYIISGSKVQAIPANGSVSVKFYGNTGNNNLQSVITCY